MGTRPAPARPGSGFESGGAFDVSAPSWPLARQADAATGDGQLASLNDDELIGALRAWRRLESWCCAGLLAATAELARRRPAERTGPAAPGEFPAQLSEFIADEMAAALRLSTRTADAYLDLALDLATRLPRTATALREGSIDHLKARLISEATRILTDEQARAVEAQILPRAGQQTPGQLRAAAARAVLTADPEAATRRREEAQKDPRVRHWREDAGTAALAGFGLPPDEVLEADQRITARALALREAGLSGSLDQLRVRAYLDTLLGQDSTPTAPPITDPSPAEPTPPRDPATVRRLAARLNLTVPLTTLLGLDAKPGSVAGFGPVDSPLARHLAALAAADPTSRCCLTVTGGDGLPIAHGCLPGPVSPPNDLGPRTLAMTLDPLARGSCDHLHQESGYHPSRRLRHLIIARTPTCAAPGCQRPAARCDLDHTIPYDQGGRTCECDLAPLCRHHHRCKQSAGWHLDQPTPGVMIWTTPAGRRYITPPDAYPT
ncbi:MAG: DUF222 domain-containing protein [Actinobacteria bacterium]|nr:DUF222 domain-containing protein [Actinomycetota bacterium]